MKRIAVIFGTRPEAIKMAPVIQALRERTPWQIDVVTTGQHREMLQQVLDTFALKADKAYDVLEPGQSLPTLVAKTLTCLDEYFTDNAADMVLVHGDTATALAAAMTGFFHHIPVGHVEAGLRTDSLLLPFPEEANRRLIDVISSLYFAPTPMAADNLRRQGIPDDQIYVTGNTVIDALLSVLEENYVFQEPKLRSLDDRRDLVVATVHRRENWGEPLEAICDALMEAVVRWPLQVVFCMHKNPLLQKTLRERLGNVDHIHLIEAPAYKEFAHLMRRSHFLATDSGGLQEEAPSLHKPVLVLRTSTERPEGLAAGTLELVGTETQDLLAAIGRLMENPQHYARMAGADNPYGDGHAADRIVDILLMRMNNWGENNGNTTG